MTAATEKPPKQQAVKAPWVAVIYVPGIESDKRTRVQRARGSRVQAMDIPMRHFTYLTPMTEEPKPGQPVPFKTFHVHPGTNMGIHYRSNGVETILRLPTEDWEAIAQQPIPASLIQMQALEIVVPTSPTDDGEPGYRHFSQEDALKLVEFHMHCSWVDRALIGETRPAVLTAANKRKEEILQEERALQAGD